MRTVEKISCSSLLLAVLLALPLRAQNIIINEFMASNSATIADPDFKENGDWVELYNSGDTAVNLKGYSFTDLFSQPKKFIITADVIVSAHGYRLLWADDHATGAHANFKLSASGEMIGIYDPSGAVVDTVTFGVQQNDVSSGRFPNGASAWFTMTPATPGSANTEQSIAGRTAVPALSHAAGFYPSSITVTITPPVGASARYTIDGHTPTAASPLYTAPVLIDSTRVLRVKAFKDGALPSLDVTATYFINEPTELPVFSLVTDPENFFSDTSGIYVIGTNGIISHCSTAPRNWNQEWERPVRIQFFEKDRQKAFDVNAGVQIYGGCTRLYAEKSLAFYFRSDYGDGSLKYNLFPGMAVNEFNNFTLRSSGQDWWRTMFRDGFVQNLVKQGMRVDMVDYRPAVMFLNGQYWGIHNIREKLNEHYVEGHFNVSGDSIDLIEISKGQEANNGTMDAYNAMTAFISSHDLSVQKNYDTLCTFVDMDEYIDYEIAQIYSANGDWPGSNTKVWRERRPGAKWRWMLYDMDFTFGGNAQGQYNTNTLANATATNGPSWPNPPWSTLMLRKLLENTGFRNEFIQRFIVHMNTTYEKNHVIAVIDSFAARIAAEIPRHITRWPQSISLDKKEWNGNVQIMRDFALNRPTAMVGFLTAKFSLSGYGTVTVGRNDPSQGRIFTQGVEVKRNNALHGFFKNIPLRLKAQAEPGFRFVRWEGVITSAAAETTIVPTGGGTLTAVFEPAALSVTAPVINEINYKSTAQFDTDDWVEFYNPAATSVDLAGWTFRKDSANIFTFPASTSIGARSYLVLVRDSVKFRTLWPEVKGMVGGMGFGLSSSGEQIQLRNTAGTVMDDVHYLSQAPWSDAPSGGGPTLALIDPQKDNALPASWRPSKINGTPGMLNDVYTEVEKEEEQVPGAFRLYDNFPNPFNPTTTIRFALPNAAHVRLTIHSVLGTEAAVLVDGVRPEGVSSVEWNAAGFPSGVYFYTLRSGNDVTTKRLLLLK